MDLPAAWWLRSWAPMSFVQVLGRPGEAKRRMMSLRPESISSKKLWNWWIGGALQQGSFPQLCFQGVGLVGTFSDWEHLDHPGPMKWPSWYWHPQRHMVHPWWERSHHMQPTISAVGALEFHQLYCLFIHKLTIANPSCGNTYEPTTHCSWLCPYYISSYDGCSFVFGAFQHVRKNRC